MFGLLRFSDHQPAEVAELVAASMYRAVSPTDRGVSPDSRRLRFTQLTVRLYNSL